MFPVLSDHKLYEYTGGCPPQSIADLAAWFGALESRQSPDGEELWLTWLLFTNEGNTAIGYVQATVTGHAADIAWLVGSEWQGIGYASEAATALTAWLHTNRIHAINANIHPDHSASQKVAQAAGLHYSGQIKDGEEVWLMNSSTSTSKL
jgi:RimJ/RimL family protein N-acetyltransferase